MASTKAMQSMPIVLCTRVMNRNYAVTGGVARV